MSRKRKAETDASLEPVEISLAEHPDFAGALVEAAGISAAAQADPATGAAAAIPFREIPIDQVFPSPLNPRKRRSDEGIEALAASIAEKGLLQPILVRPDAGGDTFEIILGARRHAAALLARQRGLLPSGYAIPARVRACNDDELVILAGVENFDREDMEPLDEAELFAAVRPRITPNPGERPEAAIARLFHIGERTVFRRLALLKCAPEVQTALREQKITLAHAQAYSMGPAEKQQELLADQLGTGENRFGEPLTADDIRYELVEQDDAELVAVDGAKFDLALYTGGIVEDPESGDRYFADRTQFERLQAEAERQEIDGVADELGKSWPWVDIRRHDDVGQYQMWDVPADHPKAGAVVWRDRWSRKVESKAPALRPQDREDRRPASRQASESTSEKPASAGRRPPLSQPQLERLHAVKTQALRRAIAARRTHDGRVPMALACLGMLGAHEIRWLDERMENYGNRAFAVPSLLIESTRRDHLLQTARLALPDKLKKVEPSRNSAAAAAWLGALMGLPADDLVELFGLLVAERCGSWLSIDKPGPYSSTNMPTERLGDSDLTVAIAAYTEAELYLRDAWQPDRDWFAQYGKDRLFRIAHDQCRVRNANTLKKGELVDVALDQPKGFWTVSLFPEARFQSEADAAKALDLERSALPAPPHQEKAA